MIIVTFHPKENKDLGQFKIKDIDWHGNSMEYYCDAAHLKSIKREIKRALLAAKANS